MIGIWLLPPGRTTKMTNTVGHDLLLILPVLHATFGEFDVEFDRCGIHARHPLRSPVSSAVRSFGICSSVSRNVFQRAKSEDSPCGAALDRASVDDFDLVDHVVNTWRPPG